MSLVTVQGFDLGQTGSIDTDQLDHGPESEKPSRFEGLSRRASRPFLALRAVPHVGTWAGVVLATIGAVLLAVAWGRTAGLTNVGLQVPYIVSAGFTGLGLVAVGLTVVNLSAKQEDSRERLRQTGELRELLTELRRAVGDERVDQPPPVDAPDVVDPTADPTVGGDR